MTDVCLAGVVGGLTIEPAPCYLDSNRVHRSRSFPGQHSLLVASGSAFALGQSAGAAGIGLFIVID